MKLERPRAVLVIEARLGKEPPASGWLPGPLPVNAGEQGPTEAELRRTYFEERVADALHGSDSSECRWHSTPDSQPEGLRILACELLRFAGDVGSNVLFAVHVELPEDPLTSLEGVAHINPHVPAHAAARAWFAELLPPGASIPDSTRRAFCLSISRGTAARAPLAGTSDAWSGSRRSLFHLAAATTSERFRPHPDSALSLFDGFVPLSATWEALVLRDGAAFVVTTDDVGEAFAPAAERYVRSIYLDAFLLGIIQRIRLHRIADEVAALGDPTDQVDALLALQRAATSFRNRYWWQHLTGHGPANDLLAAYQRQHRLAEISTQIFEELAEYSQQAQTAAARRQDRATARGNALLALITVIGLPFGIALSVVQALGTGGWWVVLALVLAAMASAGIASSAVGRELLAPLRSPLVRRAR